MNKPKRRVVNMVNEIQFALNKAREFDEDNFHIACYLCGYLESLLKKNVPSWDIPEKK